MLSCVCICCLARLITMHACVVGYWMPIPAALSSLSLELLSVLPCFCLAVRSTLQKG